MLMLNDKWLVGTIFVAGAFWKREKRRARGVGDSRRGRRRRTRRKLRRVSRTEGCSVSLKRDDEALEFGIGRGRGGGGMLGGRREVEREGGGRLYSTGNTLCNLLQRR